MLRIIYFFYLVAWILYILESVQCFLDFVIFICTVLKEFVLSLLVYFEVIGIISNTNSSMTLVSEEALS